MSCDTLRERLTARLSGEVGEAELRELAVHLERCPSCAAEARELEALWNELGEIPVEVPSARMRRRFERTLAEATPRRSGATRPRLEGGARSLLPLAATLILGLAVGYLVGNRGSDDIAALRGEVSGLRETVALTLLEHGTVSERLQGVAFGGSGPAQEDPRFAAALFTRLLEDPNVNVRLAAIEALRPLAADRRDQLVAAVTRQQSPLVAISLIDLLLEADGSAVRQQLQALSADPKLDPAIRGYLRDRLGRSV